MIPQLDHWDTVEHPVLAHVQVAIMQRVDITLNEQEVRAGFHRQETRAGNVDTMGVVKVFDSCARRSLELPAILIK